MSISETPPPFDLPEDSLTQDCKDLISSLPRKERRIAASLYQYQGFWYRAGVLQGVLNCQKHFEAKDTDIIIVSYPKSGTTWFKALIFALMHRNRFLDSQEHHPLLTNSPHSLIPFLEMGLFSDAHVPDLSGIPSPRLFGTHIPLVSLPESVKGSSCKTVYCCRNPKDTFVSLWHFRKKLRSKEAGSYIIDDLFDEFCEGSSVFGPFWDHVLAYWKESLKNPGKVLFLMYEEMKEQPVLQIKRMADFLGCSFNKEEEAKGTIDDIIKLCSFDTLSNLDANKNGKLSIGVDTNVFFRKGETGGWRNILTASMAKEIDRITEEKFCGSGLKFHD